MNSKTRFQRPSQLLLGFLLLSYLGTNSCFTSASPLKSLEAAKGDLYQNDEGESFLINPLALPLSQGRQESGTTAKKDDDEGWSTMDYVWLALGILAALIILSCVISYLFCACVKEIICIPCTIIGKCFGCCCGD